MELKLAAIVAFLAFASVASAAWVPLSGEFFFTDQNSIPGIICLYDSSNASTMQISSTSGVIAEVPLTDVNGRQAYCYQNTQELYLNFGNLGETIYLDPEPQTKGGDQPIDDGGIALLGIGENLTTTGWTYTETGDYRTCFGRWSAANPCSNTVDGNFNTYGEVSDPITLMDDAIGTMRALGTLKYSISPCSAFSANVLYVKDGSGTANITLPSQCRGEELTIGYLSQKNANNTESTKWYCEGLGGRQLIRTSNSAKVYEEGLWTYSSCSISGDSVSIDDSKATMSVTPHTLTKPGWVDMTVKPKSFTGNVNLAWGFNSTIAKPMTALFYDPYNITHSLTCPKGGNIWYNYSVTQKQVWCWQNTTGANATTRLLWTHDYETANLQTHTITWNELVLWKDVTDRFGTINYYLAGVGKWFYVNNFPVTAGKTYKFRAYINLPICYNTDCPSVKYDFIAYPTTYGTNLASAFAANAMFILDPWLSSGKYRYRRELNIKNRLTQQVSGDIMPINGTSGTDIDLNGVKEYIYAGNCSNSNTNLTLYYNSSTAIGGAYNSTSSSCMWFKTLPTIDKGTSNSPALKPGNLSLYYPQDNSETTVWNPMTNVNGTMTGNFNKSDSGKIGRSLFWGNKVHTFINTTKSDFSNDFTISFWMKTNKTTSKYVFTSRRTSSSYVSLLYTGTGIDLEVRNYDGGANLRGYDTSFTDTTISNGQWHHIVVDFDQNMSNGLGNNITYWYDGVKPTKLTRTLVGYSDYTNAAPNSDVIIGGQWRHETNRVIASLNSTYIDDLRWYNKNLTANEVSDLYNLPTLTHVQQTNPCPAGMAGEGTQANPCQVTACQFNGFNAGLYYKLMNDVSGTLCFAFDVKDMIFDCGGKKITDTVSNIQIVSADNITIKNCVIDANGGEGALVLGSIGATDRMSIINNTIYNTPSDACISFQGNTANSIIKNNRLSSCLVGLGMAQTTTNTIVLNNNATNNLWGGFNLGQITNLNNTITNNTAANNGGFESFGYGFAIAGTGIKVINNSAYNVTVGSSPAAGIWSNAYNSTFTDNTGINNTWDFYDDGSAINNNVVNNLTITGGSNISFTYSDVAIKGLLSSGRPTDPAGKNNISKYLSMSSLRGPSDWINLTFNYNDAEWATANVLESTLGIQKYSAGWAAVTGSEVDIARNKVTANITDFTPTVFAPMGDEAICPNFMPGAGTATNPCQIDSCDDDPSIANLFYELTTGISSTGNCLSANVSNISINGAKNTLAYGSSGTGNGINIGASLLNVTIKNFVITNTGGSSTRAINMPLLTSGYIINNTISISGVASNIGIFTVFIGGNISYNNITNTGTGTSNYGMQPGGSKIYVGHNTITTSGTNQNYGMNLASLGADAVLVSNNITTGGSSTDNYGMYFSGIAGGHNNITSNRITTSGTGNDFGIQLTGVGGTYNHFKSNTINAGGTGNGNNALKLTGASNNNFTSNYFGSGAITSVSLINSGAITSSNNIFLSNTINITATSSTVNGGAVRISAGTTTTSGNTFTNDKIAITAQSVGEFKFDKTTGSNIYKATNINLSRSNQQVSFKGFGNTTIKGILPSEEHYGDPLGMHNITHYFNITGVNSNSWLYFNISYKDSQLVNVYESTLQLQGYRTSAPAEWELLPGPPVGVDQVNNYVYSNLTTFHRVVGGFGSNYPIITFVSQAPSDLNSINGIPNMTIVYNITSAVGVSDPSVLIYHKDNSSTSNIGFFINGTKHTTYSTNPYYTKSGSLYTFILDDNEVYPATYNLNQSLFDSTVHTAQHLDSATKYLKLRLYNVTADDKYGIFEIMANQTLGASRVIPIYYCNSTYTTGAIGTSPNCVQFCTIAPSAPYNHSSSSNSNHMVCPFVVNQTTKSIGNVKVSPTSYFAVRGVSTSPDHVNVWHIPTTTRTDQMRLTQNNGVTWASQAYTVDAHLHQFTDTDKLWYYVCASDIYSNSSCSAQRSDLMELGGLPPTAPGIYSPGPMDAVYSGQIWINWTAAVSPNDYTITNYEIKVVYLNGSYYDTSLFNTTDKSYLWNIAGVPGGTYIVRVTACDSLNQCSTGTSPRFIINSAPVVNNVTVGGPYNPVSNSTTNIMIRVGVTDDDDWDDINISATNCTISNTTLTIATTSCVNDSNTSKSVMLNCSATMQFYYKSGSWSVTCSSADMFKSIGTNSTQSLTYNRLESIATQGTSDHINWININASSTDVGANDDPLKIINLGNAHFSSFNLTGYNLTNGDKYVAATDFSANNIDAANGENMLLATPVTVTGVVLPFGPSSIANVYLYLEQVTKAIPANSYTSSSPWPAMVYGASSTN